MVKLTHHDIHNIIDLHQYQDNLKIIFFDGLRLFDSTICLLLGLP